MRARRLGILLLCAALLLLPIKAAEGEKLVALTFDDGPSGRFTRRLLDGLAERDARATFLLCGYRMEQYPELTERICREGHEIGIHGYTHDSMVEMSRDRVDQEIRETMDLLPAGCEPSFLRPPGGQCGGHTAEVAAARGLAVLRWSLDPRDWATDDTEAIRREILRQVRDGDVVLLHDMSDSSVDAALAVVDELQGQGFQFVTVSELARARGTAVVPGKCYARFDREQSSGLK